MIDLWTARRFNQGKPLPLVFTEDNWSDHPNDPIIDDGHSIQYCGNANGCEGAYIVDLFTWLFGHRRQYNTTNAPNSQLRVAIYRGANKPITPKVTDILGLFTVGGGPKRFALNHCAIHGSELADYYNKLRTAGCY